MEAIRRRREASEGDGMNLAATDMRGCRTVHILAGSMENRFKNIA
jgi:hypothetical protein